MKKILASLFIMASTSFGQDASFLPTERSFVGGSGVNSIRNLNYPNWRGTWSSQERRLNTYLVPVEGNPEQISLEFNEISFNSVPAIIDPKETQIYFFFREGNPSYIERNKTNALERLSEEEAKKVKEESRLPEKDKYTGYKFSLTNTTSKISPEGGVEKATIKFDLDGSTTNQLGYCFIDYTLWSAYPASDNGRTGRKTKALLYVPVGKKELTKEKISPF